MKSCKTCRYLSMDAGDRRGHCHIRAPIAFPPNGDAYWPYLGDHGLAIGCGEHKPSDEATCLDTG